MPADEPAAVRINTYMSMHAAHAAALNAANDFHHTMGRLCGLQHCQAAGPACGATCNLETSVDMQTPSCLSRHQGVLWTTIPPGGRQQALQPMGCLSPLVHQFPGWTHSPRHTANPRKRVSHASPRAYTADTRSLSQWPLHFACTGLPRRLAAQREEPRLVGRPTWEVRKM